MLFIGVLVNDDPLTRRRIMTHNLLATVSLAVSKSSRMRQKLRSITRLLLIAEGRCEGRRENRMPPPPYVKLGRKILYIREDLDRWLATFRVEP